MTDTKVYAGTSAFFANRKGNHDWLANNNRPFLSLVRTDKEDKRAYMDLFLNTQAVSVKVNKDTIVLTIRKTVSAPMFRILDKE